MIKLELVVGVITFVLWVYSLVDAISTPTDRVRNLPKVAWVLLILFFPLVGSIAWLVAGRPEPSAGGSVAGRGAGFPEYERPGRFAATDPARDEDFLRGVRERAEAQRRRYEEQRKRDSGSSHDPDPAG